MTGAPLICFHLASLCASQGPRRVPLPSFLAQTRLDRGFKDNLTSEHRRLLSRSFFCIGRAERRWQLCSASARVSLRNHPCPVLGAPCSNPKTLDSNLWPTLAGPVQPRPAWHWPFITFAPPATNSWTLPSLSVAEVEQIATVSSFEPSFHQLHSVHWLLAQIAL